MMKRILFTTLLAAVSAALLPAATISLQFSSNQVTLGDNFTVTVNATNVFAGRPEDMLLAFGLNPFISLPGNVIFLGASVGPRFADDSGSFLGTAVAGDVFPGLGAGDFVEPLTLATLTFRAIGSGFVDVGVVSDTSDLNQGLAFLADSNNVELTASGTIQVVPEPAVAWLLAPGLGALLLMRRRRRA